MSAASVFDVVAYIDAGTGSYLLAAIASGAAGLWMFFRSGLVKLRRKVTRSQPEMVESDDVVLDETEPEEPVARG